MRILIAEDDPECRRIMYLYLAPLGNCDAVADGRIALECVRRAMHQGNHYDLICLDIMMPNLDGHQTLKKIRDMENHEDISFEERAKIIMITAMGDSEHVMNALNESCNAYIVKPVDKALLYKEIYSMGLASDSKH